MSTSNRFVHTAFAIWITGLPASGKTTIATRLLSLLHNEYRVWAAHLESDRLRTILTPAPTYSREERDAFYKAIASLAGFLVADGVPVVIDATANLKSYREAGRAIIPRFLEVYVQCPLEVCIARDPKGIYNKAVQGVASSVPGLQDPYEEPDHPDVVVHCARSTPDQAARMIVQKLAGLSWI